MRNDLLNLATELVEHHLPSPRLEHTLAVGYRARQLAERLGLPGEVVHHLEVSGVLHDIGYGVDLVDTGHHAFDGGLFLRQHDLLSLFAPDVCWHSTAYEEGLVRNIPTPDIPYPSTLRHHVLFVADFTTGPAGQQLSIRERLRDIRSRYGPEDPPVLALNMAGETLREAARVVDEPAG